MSKEFNIVSIGAGNVANHLIPALHSLGCKISQVYSRDIRNARSLARKVKANAIDSFELLDDSSDLYLIMVHDDIIKDIVSELPQLDSNQFLAHTSGATPTNFLIRKAKNYGSFYPLQSFKKGRQLALEEVPFLLYGSNPKTLRKFRMLARQLSPVVKEANDNERLKYHLAAVLMNNFTNHLACLTEKYLNDEQLDPKILKPITSYTFSRIAKSSSVCEIQTGPAKRDDNTVIKKHLALIKEDKTLTEIYKVMTKSIKKTEGEKHKN